MTTTMRAMPTEKDLREIRSIAETHSGQRWIKKVTATSGGVLIAYSRLDTVSPAPSLEAVGYSTTQIRSGLVLVTGVVDQVALVDAQTAALTERRRALVAEREDEDEFEARMGGSF